MTNSVQSLLAQVSQYQNNPAGIQRSVIGMLREVSDGKIDLVDPTNPVVFVLEAAATLTAAAIVENKTLNRKHYPFSAQTIEDLYPHMSDKDYVDRFAVPATTKIAFFFEKEELLSKLVDEGSSGIKKIVIPRNTYVTVAEINYSLQYPIEIRQMAHGGLQIVYNAEQTSPLQTLTTNIIEWKTIKDDSSVEYISFEVDFQQFDIVSRTSPLNAATGFKTTIELGTGQQYYYCRVWVDEGDGTFTEMQTTHTDEIYDVATPTAVLRVLDGQVEIKIPQIYLTTGLLNKSVRMDVYQTRGPLSINLANYLEQFVITFMALNRAEQDEFVAPLKGLRSKFAASTKMVSGGRNAMSFSELRTRVIRNAIGAPSLPITNIQVESTLERAGYTVVKNVDNITNRVFLATRGMPDPEDQQLITAAAAGIGTLATKISDAVQLDTVVDNGDIVTIMPQTLYRVRRGLLEFVSSAEAASLALLPPDKLALAVTNGNYMYTPFHYVLDSSNNQFSSRPYYLDSPAVETKSFIAENDTTLLQVSTNSYVIERTEAGYKLTIKTRSSDAFKALDDDEVFVQLAFVPQGDVDRAYMRGTLLMKEDDERIYEFDLSSNYRINADNEIAMTNFQMFNETPRVVDLPLLTNFDVFYSTSASLGPQWRMSEIDSKLGAFQLPANTFAITHEQLNIRLGWHLEHLWSRARSVVSEAEYEKWTVDVPATYTKDVYELDANGSAVQIVNGVAVVNVLHHIGDPVLDANGDPVYKHRVGDVKYDAYGAPVVVSSRGMQRQMDLFMVEGAYYFATNQVTINYRREMVETIVSWLTNDLPNMGSNLLEQTKLFYYPTTTLGSVDVMFGGGLSTTLNAGQFFEVTLYVRSSVYSNVDLRNSITRKTIQTISEALTRRTISMSDVVDELRNQYQDDVISLEIKGLGGASNLNVVTMTDDSKRLSIRKRLESRNDETLVLSEDVTINFVRHERRGVVAS